MFLPSFRKNHPRALFYGRGNTQKILAPIFGANFGANFWRGNTQQILAPKNCGAICSLSHCTPLAMRGTCSPWSAHPQVQRSAVRQRTKRSAWGSIFGTHHFFNFRGDISLIQTKLGFFACSWAPTVLFFSFRHRLRYPYWASFCQVSEKFIRVLFFYGRGNTQKTPIFPLFRL